MIRRLLIAAFFLPRQIVRAASPRGGSHRTDVPLRPDIVLALALGGITVFAGGLAFAVFHLVVFKEVAR